MSAACSGTIGSMKASELSRIVKSLAFELGFDQCGVAEAAPVARSAYLRAWLDGGRAGSMHYLHKHFRQRSNPAELLPGAKSVIVVALQYGQPEPPQAVPNDSLTGRVAMYAWGDDYHKVVKAKLLRMVDRLRTEVAEPFDYKACVDTAPVLERELAAAAGVGWIGKNTMVLHPHLGSYFFLGAVVTTLELTPDEPMADHCGTCTACLEACPTGALPAPYEMDASRCISYLTIERRQDLPQSLTPKMGNWVFGCDVCQEVCPHNRRAPTTREPRFAIRPPGPRPMLVDILNWSSDDYRQQLRGGAMKRATLDMLKRNASVAKTNCAGPRSEV